MKKPMICPKCGIEMNHHANKINYAVASETRDVFEGGLLEEVHTCPNCGRTEARPADVE
jgi:ribosomal protein S27AE